ncbi:MAG TPA: metallophosphatase domain-containing protein [Verrucomicrobiales bacterium]|nr:metallophosphatase domain-containing protein [Verrucomicrobiales bacterium]
MPKPRLSIVALSDTHGMHASMKHGIPDGDVLIHSGDFCGHGRMQELLDFAEWMGALPHPHKLITPGNHDRPVEEYPQECREAFAARGIQLLIGETAVVSGIHFFGSPYTPTFFNWHFMRERGAEIRTEWEKIPDDTHVVITHGPPYGHGDLTCPWKGDPPRNAGCLELLTRLRTIRPAIHLCGHIHEGYGITISDEVPGTTFLNASICTESYRPDNAPHRFELLR